MAADHNYEPMPSLSAQAPLYLTVGQRIVYKASGRLGLPNKMLFPRPVHGRHAANLGERHAGSHLRVIFQYVPEC